jgi:hypothetical protein
MPGVNDDAVGYDINRIIQALNGTNLLPITIGSLTVVNGPIIGEGSTTVPPLELVNGDSTNTSTKAQIGFGWANNAPSFTYQHWIATEHNAGTANINRIKFYTSDGTLNGVFPTNAVLGMTIENGTVTPKNRLNVLGDYSTVGDNIVISSNTASTKGGWIGFADAGTDKWELGKESDQSLTLWDNVRAGAVLHINSGSSGDMTLQGNNGNVIIGGTGYLDAVNGVYFPPTSSAPGSTPYIAGGTGGFADLFLHNHSGNWIYFIPDSTNNQTTFHNDGQWNMGSAVSIPPSAGGTLAATSYGTLPVKISENALGSDTTSVSFSSIPGGFRHLLLHFKARSDQATTAQECGIQFNSDTTAGHYVWERLTLSGTTFTGQDSGTSAGSIAHIFIPGTSVVANSAGEYEVVIQDYANTSWHKNVRSDGGFYSDAAFPTANKTSVEAVWGSWNSTSAITTVTIFPATGKFKANSIFTLYGIA